MDSFVVTDGNTHTIASICVPDSNKNAWVYCIPDYCNLFVLLLNSTTTRMVILSLVSRTLRLYSQICRAQEFCKLRVMPGCHAYFEFISGRLPDTLQMSSEHNLRPSPLTTIDLW